MSHRCGGVRLSHPLDTLAAVVLWCVHCQQVYMIRIWRFEESHIEATAAAGWMNTFPKMLNFSFKSFLLLLWSNSCSVGQVNVARLSTETLRQNRDEAARRERPSASVWFIKEEIRAEWQRSGSETDRKRSYRFIEAGYKPPQFVLA